MSLRDYFKGPQYKAKLVQLEADIHKLQVKHSDLQAAAREIGLLDLQSVKRLIQDEEDNLGRIKSQASAVEAQLDAARSKLEELNHQILGAEDTVLLESFALYRPKYQFVNSLEYKKRLDEIREEQKQNARSLSEQFEAFENEAEQLTKSEWKRLRKDAAKLALRSFNSESEFCIDPAIWSLKTNL